MNVLGMAVHSFWVHFPIALFILGSAAQLARWIRKSNQPYEIEYRAILAGWILLIPAMISGLVDFSIRPLPEAALSVGQTHLALAFLTAVIYALNGLALLKLRHRPNDNRLLLFTVLLGATGLVAVIFVGHFGARLVYQFGIGVKAF